MLSITVAKWCLYFGIGGLVWLKSSAWVVVLEGGVGGRKSGGMAMVWLGGLGILYSSIV